MVRSKKSGISLIALVVTIIVLLILTAAVVVTFREGGIVDRAKESVFKSDIQTYKEVLLIKNAENVIDKSMGEEVEELNAATTEEIQEIIPEFKEEYEGLVEIVNGKLVLGADVEDEGNELYAQWLDELRIYEASEEIEEETTWDNSQADDFYYDETGTIIQGDYYNLESGYKGSQENIIIPDFVTEVGDMALYGAGATSVLVPKGITRIGNGAFMACDFLVTLNIPVSVTSIGSDAFGACNALTEITYEGTKAQWNNIEINQYSGIAGKTIHCTDGDITL